MGQAKVRKQLMGDRYGKEPNTTWVRKAKSTKRISLAEGHRTLLSMLSMSNLKVEAIVDMKFKERCKATLIEMRNDGIDIETAVCWTDGDGDKDFCLEDGCASILASFNLAVECISWRKDKLRQNPYLSGITRKIRETLVSEGCIEWGEIREWEGKGCIGRDYFSGVFIGDIFLTGDELKKLPSDLDTFWENNEKEVEGEFTIFDIRELDD